MDQLNHLIDTTFSDIEKFESSNRPRYTLQSLYEALHHQLQDVLMVYHEFEAADSCNRSGTIIAVARQCHWTYSCTEIGSILKGYTYKVVIRLCV